jgi:hypothetical protein
MEIAHVDMDGTVLRASGTQIGGDYELRYQLDDGARVLRAHVVGGPDRTFDLDGADFFDLGYSPLFNSLPVLRDGLLSAQMVRVYRMRWVSVPALDAEISVQRYEPLGDGRIRFTAGDFLAEIVFDSDGLVGGYAGLAERIRPGSARG